MSLAISEKGDRGSKVGLARPCLNWESLRMKAWRVGLCSVREKLSQIERLCTAPSAVPGLSEHSRASEHLREIASFRSFLSLLLEEAHNLQLIGL